MKSGYVQMFDQKTDAETALGRIMKIFPNHDHKLIDSCAQVQVWKTIEGQTSSDQVGKLDDNPIYIVISVP